MEKTHLVAQFKEKKKTIESSRELINTFLEEETLGEEDRVRLTRVLQIVDRYAPERNVKEEAIDRWKQYLKSAYRFLPRREKSKKPIDNISAKSYLLAEKTIASLRDLRHVDVQLGQDDESHDDAVLNQERSGEVVSKETLDTSITLEYEKKNWGVERICLDGIQNHLPSDSKGERVWIRCLVNDVWVPLAEAEQSKDDIKAVRFADDGVGFDVKNLSLLYSTKADEKESRGQFGEGMKMMAAAALREGLEPEMESQDWRAKPIPKEVIMYDTRNKKNQKLQQLAFNVEHLAGETMIGSRTTFWKPTGAFVDELMQVEKKVLALREHYRPLFSGEGGDIVDREPGGLFVKGIHVTEKDTLFSYNLTDVETNRDRNAVVDNVGTAIVKILKQISDKKILRTMFQKSLLNPNAIESSYYNVSAEHPTAWVEAFHDAFGEDAVLHTGFETPLTFRGGSKRTVKMPSGIANVLLSAGVMTDKESVPDFLEETIPTSLTLEYGKDIWDEERILLDAIQNHLPNDSGGSSVGLRFKTHDGVWRNFSELPDTPDDMIEAIRIYDNGRGYDARMLGLFYSTKKEDQSSGKFGEGLKMLSVASLRAGIDITLRSQDWMSKPKSLRQDVDGKQIDQLVFDVTHFVKERENDDPEVSQSSSTTFSNPTSALLEEFRNVNKKVLAIENPRPVERTEHGDVLALDGGTLYVRQLLIPGEHELAFTYHLPELEIKNRDRNVVGRGELTDALSKVWSEVGNKDAIKSFLFKANLEAGRESGDEKIEFSMSFEPKDVDEWKALFEEIFGKDTAIRDVRSEDYDAMQQNMHVGLEIISFPTNVYRVLKTIDLPTYESRLHEMTDVEHVSEEELTQEERELMKVLSAIDEYLPNNRPSEIKVYNRKRPDQKVAAGFSDGVNVHLLRDILSDFTEAADVYVHEKVHHNTEGAQDASSGFRNYLTFALSRVAVEQLKKVRPDLLKEEASG